MYIPHTLKLESVKQQEINGHAEYVQLHTNVGVLETRLHKAQESNRAIIWVGGVGGGLNGPANGVYHKLAEKFVEQKINSLCVDYRYPLELNECILDVGLSIGFLKDTGIEHIVLVGHSAGGATVITTGALDENVIGVVALSSQTYGADLVSDISPRPILLIHGTADEVLPDYCSRDLYSRAFEPKKLILYSDCGHVYDGYEERLEKDLEVWIAEVFQNTTSV